MQANEAIYRKYRFKRFGEIAGQEHIVRALRNAIKNHRLSHAYLFSGPRGTGKTSTARLLARALNCLSVESLDPCGECENCRAIEEGRFLDVIELDAASHTGVDSVRAIIEEASFHPTQGRYKTYIIDEAHMLSKAANNAFLKTLEEPPPHVVFILATTEKHKVLETIHSRCQCYDFRRLSTPEILSRLETVVRLEGEARGRPIEIDLPALTLLARNAGGSMRDALSALEQVIAYSDGAITAAHVLAVTGRARGEAAYDFIATANAGDSVRGLALVDELSASGVHFTEFYADLMAACRNLAFCRNGVTDPAVLGLDPELARRAVELARGLSVERLRAMGESIARTASSARYANDLKLHTEFAHIDLTARLREADERQIHTFLTEEVLDRLIQLETKVEFLLGRGGSPAPPSAGTSFAPRPAPPRQDPPRPAAPPPASAATAPAAPAPAADATPRRPPHDAAGEPLTLASVNGLWDVLLERVRERRAQTHAMLLEGRPAAVEGDTLVVSFDARFEWHAKQLSEPKRVADVELALFDLFKRKVALRIERAGGEAPPRPQASAAPPSAPAAAPAAPEPGEMATKLLDLFGGKIVSG